jgi:hypothetical protein
MLKHADNLRLIVRAFLAKSLLAVNLDDCSGFPLDRKYEASTATGEFLMQLNLTGFPADFD